MNKVKTPNNFLEYIENQKLGGELVQKTLKFDRIYPNLSGNIQKQTSPFNPPALTMVAFLNLNTNNKKRFDSVMNKIGILGYKICGTTQPHCTLLGLLPNEGISLNPLFEQLIKEKIIEFIDEWKSTGNQIKFNLNFKRIRPGSWYGLQGEIVPLASDGTIVAIGELGKGSENEGFNALGKDLALFLISKLPSIFGNGLEPKYPTIWCTLGYFDTDDFIMNKPFVDRFSKWESLSGIIPSISITKLQLVRTRFRSLECSDIICEFN